MASKAFFRAQLLLQRKQLTPIQVREYSTRITEQAVSLVDWSAAGSLHIYEPLLRHREADSTPLRTFLQTNYPAINIATWEAVDGGSSRWITAQGLGAPVSRNHLFDVIVVPLVGFDDSLHRIGFGGGFYDRFLAAQPQAVKIGFGYELSRATFTPESHDVPLDIIITELGTYTRK